LTSKAIRLATLLPGKGDDLLQVKLEQHELGNESLQYQALSYCWGNGKRECPIESQEGVVMVMSNLVAALGRLRQADNLLVLWIDAICIDQSNLKERSEQVSIMGEIFKRVDRVFIWLGEEDFTTTIAYTGIRSLMDGLWELAKEKKDAIARLPSLRDVCKYLKIPGPNFWELYAMEQLFQRPWFTRAWVYQECIFARTTLVVTGAHSVEGMWFAAIFRHMLDVENIRRKVKPKEMRYWLGTGIVDVYGIFMPWAKTQEYWPKANYWDKLHSLLTFRRGAAATDPLDLIYSLLGTTADNPFENYDRFLLDLMDVPSDIGIRHIDPDYSMSLETVYTSTARQIITGTKNLDLLSKVGSKLVIFHIPSKLGSGLASNSNN
jgi:hypothetical protein